jgi:hypothetical protein
VTLRFFIKISVSAVGAVCAVQGRFYVHAQKSENVGQAAFVFLVPTNAAAIGEALCPRHGRGYALVPKSHKAGRVVLSSEFAPKLTVNVVLALCAHAFFGVGVGRAHLHIPPECRTEKPYNTCGFAGSLEAQKRRVP